MNMHYSIMISAEWHRIAEGKLSRFLSSLWIMTIECEINEVYVLPITLYSHSNNFFLWEVPWSINVRALTSKHIVYLGIKNSDMRLTMIPSGDQYYCDGRFNFNEPYSYVSNYI